LNSAVAFARFESLFLTVSAWFAILEKKAPRQEWMWYCWGLGFWTGFGLCDQAICLGNSRSTVDALGWPNFAIGNTAVVVIGVDYTLVVVGTPVFGIEVAVAQCDIAQWLGCKTPAAHFATAPHPVLDYKTVGGLAIGPAGLPGQDFSVGSSASPVVAVSAALKFQTFF
jgi:hypothetical protein